jgi:hypothetical protein
MQVARQALLLEASLLEALLLDVPRDSSATIAHLPRFVSDSLVGTDASGGRIELE